MATLVAVMLDGVCDNDTTTSNEKKNQTKGTLKLLEALRHHQNESHENWQRLAMAGRPAQLALA